METKSSAQSPMPVQVWSLLYPTGIPPGEFVTALAVAEIALRAQAQGAQLKLPTPEEFDAARLRDAGRKLKRMAARRKLGVREVATEAKVTPQTVYAAIKRGALRAKKVKGEYRVRWGDAEKWFVR